MADKPVNLNRVRKERAKAVARQKADRNAAVHGLTKAERDRAKAEAARIARLFDAGQIRRDGETAADETT